MSAQDRMAERDAIDQMVAALNAVTSPTDYPPEQPYMKFLSPRGRLVEVWQSANEGCFKWIYADEVRPPAPEPGSKSLAEALADADAVVAKINSLEEERKRGGFRHVRYDERRANFNHDAANALVALVSAIHAGQAVPR